MMEIKEKIKFFPLTSGVYLMKNAKGKIIYIGKAVCLKKRVSSYFRVISSPAKLRKTKVYSKTDRLVKDIRDIEYIETSSEAEALILEASLIKKHKPRYNIDLRDDKSYPYIEITHEKFPKVAIVRPRVKNKKSKYYGPYTQAGLIREAIAIIRKIFPFRTCEPFPDKECLDFHIGLCEAPCIGHQTSAEYKKNIRSVVLILEGKKDQLYRSLKKEMEELSRARKYEKAARLRDQIRAIGALYSGTKDVNYYKETEQLQRVLRLPQRPERIEAFDISNILGNQAVGSMVSFLNGKPYKNNYRRFKIRTVEGIDDFKMIAEVVRRRYSRLQKENCAYPDLIVIDGGRGQLSAACRELSKLGLQISIISLAKRNEEVFLPRKRNPVLLSESSLGLQLLQRIRDEAHRFAVSYHRKLRNKKTFGK